MDGRASCGTSSSIDQCCHDSQQPVASSNLPAFRVATVWMGYVLVEMSWYVTQPLHCS